MSPRIIWTPVGTHQTSRYPSGYFQTFTYLFRQSLDSRQHSDTVLDANQGSEQYPDTHWTSRHPSEHASDVWCDIQMGNKHLIRWSVTFASFIYLSEHLKMCRHLLRQLSNIQCMYLYMYICMHANMFVCTYVYEYMYV